VTNICCIGRFEEIWPITATVGARVDGACPKPWELRIPRTDFSGPHKWDYVKTARNLGGEWRHKIHLLHVGVGPEGQQCCTRAMRLFCSREHLAAQIPSNCTTQPTNFNPLHHFSIYLDQFSQHADGAACSSETLKPSSQNEHN